MAGGCGDSASSCRSLETSGSGVGSGTGGGTGIATGSTGGPAAGGGGGGQGQGHGSLSQTQSTCNVTTPSSVAYQQSRPNKLSACYASCCAESAKKVFRLKTKPKKRENKKINFYKCLFSYRRAHDRILVVPF